MFYNNELFSALNYQDHFKVILYFDSGKDENT